MTTKSLTAQFIQWISIELLFILFLGFSVIFYQLVVVPGLVPAVFFYVLVVILAMLLLHFFFYKPYQRKSMRE